jgi:type IV fimbrial biogenesis protein FimT
MRTFSDCTDLAGSQCGVSLIELLIGVAVAAILTLQSLPTLRQWIDQRAVLDHAESLRSALRLARAQAMRRDAEVTVCALPRGGSVEQPACAQDTRDWSAGWVVFVDESQRGELDDGDRVLLVHQGLPQHGRVLSTLDAITYLRIGVSSSASARFTFLPPSAASDATSHAVQMLVCVNKPGRPRLVIGIAC